MTEGLLGPLLEKGRAVLRREGQNFSALVPGDVTHFEFHLILGRFFHEEDANLPLAVPLRMKMGPMALLSAIEDALDSGNREGLELTHYTSRIPAR
jgi:hypothetical protein